MILRSTLRRRVLSILAVGAAGCGTPALETVSAGVAVTGVSVLDVESGTVRPDMTVVIEEDRIIRVSPSDSLLLGASVMEIELPGAYVLPGLWDMHAHTYSDTEVREAFLPAFVLHGVTGIRDMFADCHEVCAGVDSRAVTTIMDAQHPSAETVTRWQDDIAAGRLVGPRIVRSSYIISSGPGWPSARPVSGVADARAAVLTAAERGVDFIKVYPTLAREEFLEIARVADSLGLPLAGHAPSSLSPLESSSAGMDSFEHLDRLVSFCTGDRGPIVPDASGASLVGVIIEGAVESCAEVFPTLVANGTHLVPTLSVLRGYAELRAPGRASDPRRSMLPRDILDLWDALVSDDRVPDQALAAMGVQYRIAGALIVAAHEAGVAVMAGSDTPNPNVYPGSGLHDELSELVAAGLSPLDAIRAATVVPARFLDVNEELGAVSPGYLADLVVVSENPLEDIERLRHIELVVADGRLYDREDLARIRSAIEEFSRSF